MTAFTPLELALMFAKVERELAAVCDSGAALDVLVHTAVDTVPGAQYVSEGGMITAFGRYEDTKDAVPEGVQVAH
jgi:hypothetical protein